MLQQVLFRGNHLSLGIWSLAFDLANGLETKADAYRSSIEYIVFSNHSCDECDCWLLFGTLVTEPEEVH